MASKSKAFAKKVAAPSVPHAPLPRSKFQAKTLPVGKLKEKLVASPPPDEDIQQQLIDDFEVQGFSNVNRTPSLIDQNDNDEDQNEEDYPVEEQVQERRTKLEKAPSWASRQSKKAPDYAEDTFQQVQQVQNSFIPSKKGGPVYQQKQQIAFKAPRPRTPSPTPVTLKLVELLQKSTVENVLDSPEEYMNLFAVSPGQQLTNIEMAELKQVTDIIFYWPHFAPNNFKNVTSLNTSFCPSITDFAIRWIGTYFPSLTELNVSGCRLVTESGLKMLLLKRKDTLVKCNFDMTSVRYIPNSISKNLVSCKNCPLLVKDSLSKTTSATSADLPASFTLSKIIIIKPVEMRERFIGEMLLKPEQDSIVGSPNLAICYKNGRHRVIECTEDSALVKALLTENCAVILPFDGDHGNAVAKSIESRLNMVLSLVKIADFRAIPVFSNTSQAPNSDSKIVNAIKAEIADMIKSAESAIEGTLRDKRLLTLRYALAFDLEVVNSITQENFDNLAKQAAHADLPSSVVGLFQGIEKAKLLSTHDKPFFSLDYFVKCIEKNVPPELFSSTSWASLVGVLAETGNIWLEPIFNHCEDGAFQIGPGHIISNIGSLIKFFNDFHGTVDSTAVEQDILCLALDTPLASMEKLKKMIAPIQSEHLNEVDFKRLLMTFEIMGIAIFRHKYALSLSVLRDQPPVPVEHFLQPSELVNENNDSKLHSKSKKISESRQSSKPVSSSKVVDVEYPLLCEATNAFPSLCSMLSKVLPPTLLWRNGAFFCEASFLDILVTCEFRTIKVRFSAEEFAFNIAGDETKGIGRLRAALKDSCSVIHTICCAVLDPYASSSLAIMGQLLGIDMTFDSIPIASLNHEIKENETKLTGTFSRFFDSKVQRCSNCLFDLDTIAILRRLSAKPPNQIQTTNVGRAVGSDPPHVNLYLPVDLSHGENFSVGSSIDILKMDDVQTIQLRIDDSPLSSLSVKIQDNKLIEISNGGANDVHAKMDSKKKAPQKQNDSSVQRFSVSVDSGMKVEVKSVSMKQVSVTFLTNGRKVADVGVEIANSKNYSVISMSLNLKNGIKELPLSSILNFNRLAKEKPEVGMRLEALDFKNPHLICVANIKRIEPDGSWLINFDNWDSKFDYVVHPSTSNVLFPCGFMEWVSQSPELMDQLRSICNSPTLKADLQRPLNTHYSTSPFPWATYFKDLAEKSARPAPLWCFEQSHLFGYQGDARFQGRFHDDITPLTKYCANARPSMLLNIENVNVFKTPRFLPLPALDWQLCCWPSREKLSIGRPFFLCCWPDMIHFVNESPEALNLPHVTLNAVPPLALAIVLMKLSKQPCFIPNELEQLFGPQFVMSVCPFAFPGFALKYSGAKDKTEYIEYCLRRNLIPYLLDYLTICSSFAEQSPNGHTSSTNFPLCINDQALIAAADRAVDLYLKRLHADGSSISRWTAVSVSNEKPKPKCRLLNMAEAESEFFNKDKEYCPKILCAQHAYHYTTYSKAVEVDVKQDWTSSLRTFGHFHDKFMTTIAMNADDLKELKEPLPAIYPYVMEFVGALDSSDVFAKSGIFTAKWLTELNLFKNNLKDLPAEILQVSSTLERLDLSYNRFSEVPPVVYDLKNLESLVIDYVPLQTLDEKIGQLTKLRILSLHYNCISKLPVTIANLTKLEVIDLTGMPSVANANSVTYLEEIVSFFDKNNFPKEAATILTKWSESPEGSTSLDRAAVDRLNSHLFKSITRLAVAPDTFPLDLSLYPNLERLSLANQAVVNVPESIGKLDELTHVDLSGCLLLQLISPKIANCLNLNYLNLNNCPELKTPPLEIRKRGFISTLAYFKRLAQGSMKCQRTKLMFVGLGGAGKTSLVHSLVGDVAPVSTKFAVTDGIDIKKWTVGCKDGSEVDFRMWDFAGQVVYYNTHQFFISSRAVYLLLWNIRLGHEHAGLDFWLSSIACHAPNAPVLIVGTHADEVSQERSFLPEIAYRERFSSICGFHYVSSYTGQGIENLRGDIIKTALAQKHMGEAVPVAWLNFEEKLLNREPEENEIDPSIVMIDKVEKIGDSSGIYDPEEIDQALQFLSDLGSIQYFRTDFLRDRVITNPQWIVDVMSNVVSVKKTNIVDGRLPHKDIQAIWEKYPKDLHKWLLKLTEAFDLTFPLKKEPTSIVPCLLPEDPPAALEWPNLDDNLGHKQTRLVFSFKYLPTGLFNRVQVRLCQFSDGHTIWRRGSLLRKNQHVALLTQPNATSIQVKVQGPCPENISFLILEVVDTLIVESFQGVHPDYLFSCPVCVHARATDPSMFERSRIRRAFELRIPFLQCWNYFHSVSTQELRQLFPAESTSEFDSQFSRTVQEISNIKQTLRIDILVIGCSADTEPSEMKASVSTVEVGKDIEKSFPQSAVVVVPDPDAASDAISFDQLSVLMRTARLIVFCLSDKFMASDRCQAAFFTGRETLRKNVLMILIRDFDWNKYPALAFQMNDDIFVKATTRARYKAPDVAAKIQLRLSSTVDRSKEIQHKKYPPVFISYCWQNSKDAIDRGTKSTPKSLGVTDPRLLKKFLVDNGFDCWLDIEQVGLGGLFRDIANGIRYAKVVVVCVSDEYVKSDNCLREFHFATASVKVPVILCAVGTGAEWQTSEVNLIVCAKAPFINFQVDMKENYDALLEALKKYVKTSDSSSVSSFINGAVTMAAAAPKKPALGNVGRIKTMSNIQTDPDETGDSSASQRDDAKQSSLVLHEMVELGQRKFLRQLIGCIECAGGKPYPRLVIVDVAPTSTPIEKNDEDENAKEDADSIGKLQWVARFLCEHEGGWHPTETAFSLNSSDIIRESAEYFGQIFSFIRHSASTSSLEILNPKNDQLAESCQLALAQIEKIAGAEQSFEADYIKFREMVMSLDQHGSAGGLKRSQLALGKELWLCPQHQNSMNSTAMPPNVEEASAPVKQEGAAEGDLSNTLPSNNRLRGYRAIARHPSEALLSAAPNTPILSNRDSSSAGGNINTTSRACIIQ